MTSSSSSPFHRSPFSLIACRSRSRVSSVNLSSLSLSDESLLSSLSSSRSDPRDDRNNNNNNNNNNNFEVDLVHDDDDGDNVDCGAEAPDSPTPSVCVTDVSSSSSSLNDSGTDCAPTLPCSLRRGGWGSAQTRKAYGDLRSLSAGMPLKKRARLTPSSSVTEEWGYFVDTAL